MKKKLVSLLLVASLMAMTGCGGSDKKPESNGETNQSVESTETGSSNSAADDLQDIIDDNINSENVDSAISKLNPTYKVNTTDVSEYYFVNPNISIGKSFMEMTNVASVTFEEWVGYNENNMYKSVENKYASLEEIYEKYLLEDEDEQIDITFSEGGNILDKDILGVYNITVKFEGGKYIEAYKQHDDGRVMKLKDVLAGDGYITYAANASEIYKNEISPSIQLKDVFNIDFEGNAEESLKKLTELWGEPSAIECSRNWGITRVTWIFESNTNVCVVINSVMSDEANIGSIYLSWEDSKKKMDEINNEYTDPELDDKYWYKRAEVAKPDETREKYQPNLPADIVLTLGDKSVVINKDNWKNILSELGVTPNNENGNGYYLDAVYPGEKSQGVECYSNYLKISMPYFAGMNETEISILGLTPESTWVDKEKIFGSDYKDDELPYEGVDKIKVRFYDTKSIVVEIYWK